jgi:hypothetical protein
MSRACPSPTAAIGALLLAFLVSAPGASQSRPRPPGKPAVRVLPPTPIAPETPAAGGSPAAAEEPAGDAIARLTTSLRFLPETVANLPDSASLLAPAKMLGHAAGAPDRLDSVAELNGYLRRLAEASDRLRYEVIGHSEEGREIALLAISAPENLAALEGIRQEAAALADPRRTPRAEAERLAGQGKVICYLVGGLHAGEVSAPAMLAELAFRLAASERPELAEIRRRAVVLITPVADPDGWERTVDWQRRHVDGLRAKKLPWEEVREILSPPYLGHYGAAEVDGLELSLAASRALHATLARFHPQLVADLAAGAPLLRLAARGPAGSGGAAAALTGRMAAALGALGIPGVRIEPAADRAASSDLLAAVERAGAMRCTIAVFGNGTGGTFERQVGTIEAPAAAGAGEPWPPGGKLLWSLRDGVNLGEAAALAALDWAAAHPGELLSGVWEGRQAALARGAGQPPFAWLFPGSQRDPAGLALLADRLHGQGVELHRLAAEVVLAGRPHAAGTLVVRADQPQRDALTLLLAAPAAGSAGLPQPAEGEAALSWPLLYGVAVEAIGDRRILAAPMEEIAAVAPAAGKVDGGDLEHGEHLEHREQGELFALCDEGQGSLVAARLALGAYQVDAAEAAFDAGGRACRAGSWIVQAPRAAVEPVASRFALWFSALPALPRVPRHVLALPRLALFHTWTDTRGAGWARLALDRDRVPYSLIQADDLRRGRLFERFDVILMPAAAGDFSQLVRGIGARWQPLAYTATPAAKSLGVPDASDDITGGFGAAELIGLRRFVRRGGVLAAFGNSAVVAVESQLAPGVGLGGRPEGAPEVEGGEEEGAELAVTVARRSEPLAYGFEEHTAIFRTAGPQFEVAPVERDRVALWFGNRPVEERSPPARGAQVPSASRGESTAEETEEETAPPVGRAGNSAAREGIEVEDLEAGREAAAEGAAAAGQPAAKEASPESGAEAARQPDVEAKAAAEIPPPGPFVLSGSPRLAGRLDGKPAILDLPLGKGHVVLFAFDPFHGGRDRAGLRWVYNLLLNWSHLPG